MSINRIFIRVAEKISQVSGRPSVSLLAAASILLWISTGPMFHYSDTWQLVINTGTSIITFLMVFLIQNTQNRDGEAIQIKLDELLRTHRGAQISLLNSEDLSDDELDAIKQNYIKLAEIAHKRLEKRKT
jgi:low affinity Fe/Cu permease